MKKQTCTLSVYALLLGITSCSNPSEQNAPVTTVQTQNVPMVVDTVSAASPKVEIAEQSVTVEAKKELPAKPKAETLYAIGQEVEGGIVFKLNKSKTHGVVCAPNILVENADYATAKNVVAGFSKAGKQWRLPTLDELMLISKRRREDSLFQFNGNYYWSSTKENESSGWLLHLDVDKKYNGLHTDRYGVIAVHPF